MRVLLDCRMTDWSGVGRYSQGLTRALVAVPGIEVVQMIAEGSEAPAPEAETVSARTHPFSVAGALEFGRIVRQVAPDVTHCLHFPTPVPATGPLVVTIQDLTPLAIPSVMPSAARRAVYKRWISRAVRHADRLITPSQYSAEDLGRYFPASRGRVTPVMLAGDDFTTGPVGALPDWLEGRRYVLSMGNTKPHKDLPTLLEAFSALGEESLLLALAGRDPGGYAATILGDHPAAKRVRFTGPISDDTLRALYAHAALFAFPSRYEGFGLPPLEAMGFGVPVVVAEAASLPEVVGDAAALVAPGDTGDLATVMGRILTDAEYASELSARGTARAGDFRWSRTAELTAQVYLAL